MFISIGFLALPTVVLCYRWINARRDAIERQALENGEKIRYTPQELRELGDRAPDFRYTL
jgi:hypothetical protein